jgi:LPXTG-motif cell wall-anchored protein
MQPAIKGTPEVPHQDAVPGHRAYHKGEEITVAIPEIVGQPEIKAQAAVAAQPEILAREEIKGATKEEVIAEINAVKSCTETTVPSPAIPSPTIELSYESGKGSEKIAKLSWTPDAADTEEYSVVIKQNGMDDTDGVSVKGKGEFSSAPLNPGCTDVGEFIVTRKSDDQLIAIIDFNYPDQDFTKCEPVIPENTVVNETTTTDAPVVEVTTTDAPKAIAEVTTTIKAAAVATTTEAPKATDAPATTLAPVADATAKAAIVDSTATEVKLPAADINLEINLADVYTGFGVTASDVKSVEYQIADGSWVSLTKGKSIKIPKTASKLSVRVTKTSGEKVVSEKAIVHTEAATETTVATSDTTMAPADTTAPVTTEAPASSGSSSSNNTVLYILGFAIVAGAVVMFLKKKSATTK